MSSEGGHGADAGHGADGGHEDHQGHHQEMAADFRRRFWISLALTLPLLALSPMLRGLAGLPESDLFAAERYVRFLLATVIFFYGGWPFLAGLVDEVRDRNPGMMTLIGLAITVAWVYSSAVVFGLPGRGFYWELATLIDVMLLGHWIEMRSVLGASRALEELVELMPSTAHRLDENDDTEDVPVDELEEGDRVLVKPGEKVPVDGVVVEGRTRVNQAMLTGESRPVEKGEDDEIIGGSINGESAIAVRVTKAGDESYLAQVVELVRSAQASRSRAQDLASRAARWLTFIALGVGAATLAAWLVAGRDFQYALERMVTVMVITCPHALGLAVPLVIAVSTSMGAKRGLLIRDRTAFERARNIDAVIFDKTGTLTEGKFGVDVVEAFGERDADDVLRLAASLESRSEHPIAAGIVRGAEEKGLDLTKPDDFEAIPGKGARARVEGASIAVVSPGYLSEQGTEAPDGVLERLAEGGRTVVFVLEHGEPIGAIALADVIRESSREAIETLRGMGIRPMMVTGDAEVVARAVADRIGIDPEDVFAEVLPDEKAKTVKEVQGRGLRVAMTGDGVNDAPALATADVGIAIGAGTDVAMESADIVLVDSDPRNVVDLVRLSGETYRKMIQNLWWATGYNVVAIPLAAGALYWAGILLNPAVGAGLMSVSTVIVAINARLLERKDVSSGRGTNEDVEEGKEGKE
ncbi:MAG: copper-translocating P-type ATPase [Gemmatimonadota bacterium]|nr:copper-translocating P-type ATPase [Gemmatimonadota bacterium]